MIFEPDVIILGGGVSKAFDIFSKFLNLRSNVIIKKSELGEYASLIGGYELLVQNDN
jgi:predicted NBD/HSP70 family sugar kinase